MKKIYTLLAFAFSVLVSNAQIVNIPDANFKTRLINLGVDTNNDGNIQQSEALAKTSLTMFNAFINNLEGINAFANLEYLDINNNNISDISVVNGLLNLESLNCSNNNISTLTTLNNLPNLSTMNCSINPLTNVSGIANMPNLTQLFVYNCPQLTDLSAVITHPTLTTLSCSHNNSSVLATISQANNLTSLSCAEMTTPISLTNIYTLSNLTHLNVVTNQLSQLDLSHFPNLTSLECSQNNLTNLNLASTPNLERLNYSFNNITNLDFSSVPNLSYLICSYNNITSLDLSSLNNLYLLGCSYNQLTSLDLSGLTSLSNLYCTGNNLTSLDFSQISSLYSLQCGENEITTIDLTNHQSFSRLDCSNMPSLVSIFMRNTSQYYQSNPFNFENCTNLQYICADDYMIPYIQNEILASGLTNCHTNSYCSFTPNGTFYTIQGTCRYDINGGGCDGNDIIVPNVRLTFTNSLNTGSLIDPDGVYHYDVQSGSYIIAANLENPTYFAISPVTSTVNFPSVASPFTRNFCITSNGTHNDLEVVLIPIGSARPGFDSGYKIIYKNKGTHAQSGSVNLMFNDAFLDLISSSPVTSNQVANSLTWNFSNLLPFETREITMIVNVNSPTETPAVNGGDVLNYTATITGASDETPNDNSSTLNQTVVNSFDPNDKTCIEGTTISPSMVGQYVHYVIRFENTGSANAENIVVKDMIDTTKFDITSLIPQSSSHPFITRITNTNKVEFIFENINLPFDDANNDGYVAFKIKTKPTLVVGNTFSNSANIYFDYNYPITTNTYVTTVQALENQDFEFSSIFSLSPVPTKNVLTITTKESITISSTSIYNTLGQLVQVNTSPSQTIDVSGLESGNYFIKITSDKGTSTAKFIKE
jgi:Leucine-rich repeat (LRR) protein